MEVEGHSIADSKHTNDDRLGQFSDAIVPKTLRNAGVYGRERIVKHDNFGLAIHGAGE
jgi:hypothetical protein